MAYRGTAIMGESTAALSQLESLVHRINPTAPDLARLYLTLGPRLGVRGDLAYAQAIHETDYFRFTGVVRPGQNNYAGLGATGPDTPGHSFATPEEGVLAHLQHLYAYATDWPLPHGMTAVDPRFDLAIRGSGTHIGDLNGRWAVPGTNYGERIDRILAGILTEPAPTEPYQITKAFLELSSKNRPGPCSSSGCWQGVQGIVVHRTASASMNARAIRRYFNDSPDGRYASSQFVLDSDEILLIMPVGEVAFHTAGKNYTHLGIETCEQNWGTDSWPETYRKLVWLCGFLMRMFQLPIDAVTGHFQWDPVNRPYDPTYPGWDPSQGKDRGLFTWDEFLADVQAALEPEPPPPLTDSTARIEVRVNKCGHQESCTEGILIGEAVYVPLHAYTRCLRPRATIQQEGSRVVVDIPFD